MKKLYDSIIHELETMLDGLNVDLLSIEKGEKKNDDGSVETFSRVEVEIPKGNGSFSRCRFSCKLPLTQLPVSEEELENGVSVELDEVKVTYISNQHDIYMKAKAIRIV